LAMKRAGWLGQIVKGHGHCFPDHKTFEASPDVFVEGQYKVVRVGDAVANHRGSCSKHPTSHGGKVSEGSATVFVNGKRMAREGDTVTCDTGQTAPLLRGRASVLVGGGSWVAGAQPFDPDPKAANPGVPAPLPPPGPDDEARFARLREILMLTPEGRKVLARLKDVEIVFAPGGSYHLRPEEVPGGERGRIVLDSRLSDEYLVLVLAHEAHHRWAYVSGTSPVEHLRNLSLEDFSVGMMTEEATAIFETRELWLSYLKLKGSGKLTPSQEKAFQEMNREWLKDTLSYNAIGKGKRELLARNPRATPEQLAEAGRARAIREIAQEFIDGKIVTSTQHEDYRDYYRKWYENYHRRRREMLLKGTY